VVSYSQAVLEAKLVTENNQQGEHDKQDCERNAFKRLAMKIKELYPRLPITIVAGALCANLPVMDNCTIHQWDYLLQLKEGVLKDLHEEKALGPKRKPTTAKTADSPGSMTCG
jgi:hypothetical protein